MTKEEIARAKELDLLTYFKLVEPGNLKLVGKEYRHKVHSSLTISKDSLWCWHCIGLRGRTALKYLIDVEKVPYVEAVLEINRIQGGVVHSSQPVSLPQPRAEPEAPRDFKLPKPDTNSYSAMAYLRGRCIHPNVLAFCRKEGILYQTSYKNHPNCVFVGRDGEGVAKGGSLRGCTQLQFRRDIPGSKKIYPFYIQASTKADTVEVYEAPIDAMSGASLKLMQHTGPWRSVHYLALGGTDYAALDAFLKYFPAVRKIVLCLAAANEIIIPMQAQPFSVVGMSQLTSSIANVQRKINPGLRVKGILLTMTEHTNVSDHYCGQVRSTYGNKIHVFTTEIPRNVKVQESQANAEPTILYDPKSNSAKAYIEFAKEVSDYGREEQVFERDEDALNR